mmetsp:Transcript_14514/g.24776  ORF Transcript_14514/g.24776 Transcript_14514/m.24776 type:complete len:107 (-) Transcript_14514:1516-1836(-)
MDPHAPSKEKVLRKRQEKSYFLSLLQLIYTNLMMLIISYSGFVRLKRVDVLTQIPAVFSRPFEFFSFTLPLVLLQVYNNEYKEEWARIDRLSLAISLLTLLDLLAD